MWAGNAHGCLVWWEQNKDEYIWGRGTVAERHRPPTTASRGVRVGVERHNLTAEPLPRGFVYTRVVPELIALLRDEDEEPRVLDAALRSLGVAVSEPFAEPAVEVILPHLASPYDEVQEAAALALGLVGPGQRDRLLALVADEREGRRLVRERTVRLGTRRAAALALGLADDPRSVRPLLELLDRADVQRSDLAPAIAHGLGVMQNEMIHGAGGVLLETLVDRDTDPALAAALATALGRIGRRDAVDPMLTLFDRKRTTPCVRQSIVLALGALADPSREDVLSLLTELVDESDDDVLRHFALMTLARLGARDSDPGAHAAAHDRLQADLVRWVSKPERSRDRPWAAMAAGVYAHDRPESLERLADPLLEAYEQQSDPHALAPYALGLGLAGVREAGPIIARDLAGRRDDVSTWSYLGLSLGLLAHREAADTLLEVLADRRRTNQFRNAMLGLLLMGDRRLSEEALTTVSEHFAHNVEEGVRSDLAEALAVLRVKAAVPPLLDALEGREVDDLRRAWACAALERLSEEALLPWRARFTKDLNAMVPGDPSLLGAFNVSSQRR